MFLIGNLGVGGVVRVLLNVVNNATRLRPAVAVRVAHGGLMPELDTRVPLYDLGAGGRDPVGEDVRSAGAAAPRRSLARGLTPRSIIAFWRECLALRRVLRATGSGTVVTFLMRGHLIAFTTRLLLMPRLRIIVSHHEQLGELEALLFPRRTERWALRLVLRHVMGRADAVVVPAPSGKDDLVRLGVDPRRVVVRRNPIDLVEVRRRAGQPIDLDLPPGAPVLVGVGRMIPLKGYHVLVEAAAKLPASVGAHVVIVGEGPELPNLRALAARLGVQDRIRFVGAMSNPWPLVARASCFAHPSLSEAQSLVLVESMILGVPVVAVEASGGVRNSLEDGRLGVLVPPNDPEEMAAAITGVLADRELRATLIARGHEAADRFDIPATVPQFEEVVLHGIP